MPRPAPLLHRCNINKCKLLTVARIANPCQSIQTLDGSGINTCSYYMYIGVPVTNTLYWSTHVQHLISEANPTLAFLRHYLRLAPPQAKLLAITTLVQPKLQYASSDIPDIKLRSHSESRRTFFFIGTPPTRLA